MLRETPPQWLASVALLLAACVGLKAEVALPPLFADHAVLQSGQAVNVWGWADAGESVTVAFAGKTFTTRAGTDGSWLVSLPPETPSSESRELVVSGRNTLRLRDILVGDVWLCSGQSNMEFAVASMLDAKREIASAHFPTLREIKIGRHLAEKPEERFAATAWRTGTPENVGEFTAVGYSFARQMIRETGVPVGIIQCSWSGTSIEPWMSAAALSSRPEFKVIAERWEADRVAYPERRKAYEKTLTQWKDADTQAVAKGEAAHATFLKDYRAPRPPPGAPDHPYPGNPSALYDGMVYPLRHIGLRGVLWYQGEANAVRAREYSALFRAMILDWRATFGRSELPFYWAQIANFAVDTDWPRLREAQTSALTLPNTGQAVTIEIGDPLNIHPTNKQEVGRRLALIALANLYQRPLEFSGPRFQAVRFEHGEARVTFTHGEGLNCRSGRVMSLELAGQDQVYHAAEGLIDGETLIVSAKSVPSPVAVRYAWSASPSANLYNVAGLPAAPFRSDDW